MYFNKNYKILQLLLIVALSAAEPFCEMDCGPLAVCVPGNRCVCLLGYIQTISEETGLPECRALCKEPCMDNAACVAPNKCECNAGYKKHWGECVPKCSGDCKHGVCVAPNECACHMGYVLMRIAGTEECVPAKATTSRSTRDTTNADKQDTTEVTSLDVDSTTKLTNTPNGIDLGDSVELSGSTATTNRTDGVVDTTTDTANTPDSLCPRDQIYYKGACRSTINDTCNMLLCGPHAYCDERNECACEPGYELYESKSGKHVRCLLNIEPVPVSIIESVRSDLQLDAVKVIGWTCILLAMLTLIIVLWRATKD